MADYWPNRIGAPISADGITPEVSRSSQGQSDAPNVKLVPKLTKASTSSSLEPRDTDGSDDEDSFDRDRKKRFGLLTSESWRAELKRYLDDRMPDISKTLDTVQWWHVSRVLVCTLLLSS